MKARAISFRSIYAIGIIVAFIGLVSIKQGCLQANSPPQIIGIPELAPVLTRSGGSRSISGSDNVSVLSTTTRYSLSPGQSPAQIFSQAGMSGADAYAAAMALNSITDLRRLKAGQELIISETELGQLHSVRLPISLTRIIEARLSDTGVWEAREEWVDVFHVPTVSRAVVKSSLYAAAVEAGIPVSIMMEAIKLFSFDVDFQRDIQPGNQIVVLREEIKDSAGLVVGAGRLLYARLELANRSVETWRYQRLDGEVEYYDEDGQSIRKALLKTPLDGARISSGFGVRRHPILGYSALHRGVDFAAPTGTPVLAGGDGIVQLSGRHKDYGNRVKIRHPNHYDTLYAHFSRIAPGIVPGTRVKQGQVVGYVGSTGMSTGPHCHYEVIYFGSPVNPATLKFPPGHALDAEDLRLYNLERRALMASFDL